VKSIELNSGRLAATVSDPLILVAMVHPEPDPHWECGSGSRRAKMTLKIEKREEVSSFEVLDVLF
jgi:hypothetical protein